MKTLPDMVSDGLDVLFVGTNPGAKSAMIGHYFAGASNMFWRLMHEAGFTKERLTTETDRRMLDYGYGLTDVVKRPTRSTTDLRGSDGRGARKRLDAVIARHRPGTVAFVGKAGYRYYLDSWTVPLRYGAQNPILASRAYLLPSTSGASFADTKYAEKLYWYKRLRLSLRRLRSSLRGRQGASCKAGHLSWHEARAPAGAGRGAAPGRQPSRRSVFYARGAPHDVTTPLRDIIANDLSVLFVGTSPGSKSSGAQHYFAGRSNVFWKLLFESGLTDRRLTAQQDNEMIEYKYGLTDVVKRPTVIAKIRRRDARGVPEKLNRRMTAFKPKVTAFVGKKSWQIYNKTPYEIHEYGYQRTFKSTRLYLLPSTSGQSYRDTSYDEKLGWYKALREYVRDLPSGDQSHAPERADRR